MKWRTDPDTAHSIIAIGVRGTYTISRAGPTWWLDGIGHDELPIWGLGRGKGFAVQEQARVEAMRVDAQVRESEVSGT